MFEQIFGGKTDPKFADPGHILPEVTYLLEHNAKLEYSDAHHPTHGQVREGGSAAEGYLTVTGKNGYGEFWLVLALGGSK